MIKLHIIFSKTLISFLFLIISSSLFAQVELMGWDFSGSTGFGTSPLPVTNSVNTITPTALTRGTGLATVNFSALSTYNQTYKTWGATGFRNSGTKAQAISDNTFFYFTITGNTTFSITSLNAFRLLVSKEADNDAAQDGPNRAIWQYKVGNGSYNDIGTASSLVLYSGYNDIPAVNLSGISALQNISSGTTITFRMLAYNSGDTHGAIFFVDKGVGDDLSISGITGPSISALTPPAAVCAGSSINPTAPTVSANGSAITAQGWQIENNAGNGNYKALTLPYTVASSDIGKNIRYYATNAFGTTYTSGVTISVNTPPTVANMSVPAALCAGGNINPSAPTVTANGSTVTITGWQIEMAPNTGTYNTMILPYTVSYADNGKKIRYYATNSCGTSYNNGVELVVNNSPTISAISAPAILCGAGIINLTTPTITTNGTTVTAQGWQIETAYASGIFSIITMPYSATLADNGKKIRYYATSSCETSYSSNQVSIIIGAPITTWTGATNNDWNTITNWTNGVPCSSTKVIIPDISGLNYPTITTTGVCYSIIFQPGAGVLGLQYLTYNKAYVSTTLQRSKWYTLTAPLKEMYAGDYAFSGSGSPFPVTQMRLFDEINPDSISKGGVSNTGTWSRGFSTPSVALTPGSGFAYYIDTKTYNYPGAITHVSSDFTVSFPRLNPDSSLVTSYFPYSTYSGMLLTPAWTVTKNPSFANRFAMEDGTGHLTNTSVTLKVGLNLVGNPLMTHLDFNALYASNSGTINNKVKFWNGTTFTTFMTGSQLSSDPSSSGGIIPPMQAFFVESTTVGPLNFNLTSHFVANNTVKLRSASTENGVLYIESNNETYKSSTAIALRNDAKNDFDDQDAFKLFTQIKHVPEVYTLAGNVPVDINQFEGLPYTVPLCLKTDSGMVSLKFVGAESFTDDVIIELINSKTGEVQDLKQNNNYAFKVTPTKDEGTLFVSFRSAGTTTANVLVANDKNIQIYASGENKVKVISTPNDLIKDVLIYDISGRIIEHIREANTTDFEIPVSNSNQIYLVQAFTQNNSRIEKVFIK